MKEKTMKDLPIEERPYEKLMYFGEETLSNAELLSIILKNGTVHETSLQIAQKILMLDNKNSLSSISYLDVKQLMKINGIGKVKAIQIKAVFELAKRIARPNMVKKTYIKTSKDVYDFLQYECINETQEKLFVLNLGNRNNIIKMSKIAKGGNAKIALNISQIFCDAIKVSATSIIVAHNHPSGDTTPSKQDIEFTYKIIEAGDILNIEVIDHIVISDIGFVSLKERGII